MLAAEVIPSDKRINILEIYGSPATAAYYRPIGANARVSGSTSYCISSYRLSSIQRRSIIFSTMVLRQREYLKKEFDIQRIPCYWWLLSLLSLITTESSIDKERQIIIITLIKPRFVNPILQNEVFTS